MIQLISFLSIPNCGIDDGLPQKNPVPQELATQPQ